ncbi:MAG: hypothetical protein IAG10_16890 [Planctomycetaceae bacterium]|nr:hypothetical protein [Planctomycetaceae bacterium]
MEATDLVEASELFLELSGTNPGVEVWLDEGFTDGGWTYFWIVSRFGEAAIHNLAYVRLRNGQFQRRTYDESGDDLWVDSK